MSESLSARAAAIAAQLEASGAIGTDPLSAYHTFTIDDDSRHLLAMVEHDGDSMTITFEGSVRIPLDLARRAFHVDCQRRAVPAVAGWIAEGINAVEAMRELPSHG